MKKLLILGGTNFIGRNLVERLEALGIFDLTLFNRQRTQADLFPQLNKIKGDRETDDILQIADQDWDYIIDLSCYYPAALARLLPLLKNKVEKYILISSCSAYDNENNLSILKPETAPLMPCSTEQYLDRSPASYGNRKAECDRLLMDSGLSYVILRPALVFGKYDPTDRFYYWLYQVKTKDILLMPDKGEKTFSITYVQDLVGLILSALTTQVESGAYNAISVPRVSIQQVVDQAKKLLNKNPQQVNASPDFLKEHNISQWTDMPLWIDGDHFTYSHHKAKTELGFEPSNLRKSIQETLEYYDFRGWDAPIFGIKEEKRSGLLEKCL